MTESRLRIRGHSHLTPYGRRWGPVDYLLIQSPVGDDQKRSFRTATVFEPSVPSDFSDWKEVRKAECWTAILNRVPMKA